MRKFSLLLSSIVVLALLLTACGGQQTSTSIPSTNVPPVTVESTSAPTEAPTTAATSAPTSVVPVTGAGNPSRGSNMLGFQLFDQSGNQVGQVSDLVLDLDNSRVSYVAVNATGSGNTVLIPWNSLQIQSQAGATGGQQNAFVLIADPNFLQNAPNIDLTSTLPQMCQAAGNWDATIRSFWQSGALPATQAPSGTSTAGTGTGTGTGTETPAAVSTATTSSGTGTGTGTGQGNTTGQGEQLQGVVLASQVIGSIINVGPGIGNGQGTGTGTATEAPTAAPSGTATSTTGTGSGTDTGNTGLGNLTATIQDLIVDMATGDVRYVVISTANMAENWIPVPLNMFRCDMANNAFMTIASANALQSAPFFTQDQFPDTSTTGWDQQWSDFWSTNAGMGTGTGTGTETPSAMGTATATP